MKLTRVGVDLAKQVFQVHGVDRAEQPIWCQRLKRGRWITEFERNVEPGCEIGMGCPKPAVRQRKTNRITALNMRQSFCDVALPSVGITQR